jgi:hypothetical protein
MTTVQAIEDTDANEGTGPKKNFLQTVKDAHGPDSISLPRTRTRIWGDEDFPRTPHVPGGIIGRERQETTPRAIDASQLAALASALTPCNRLSSAESPRRVRVQVESRESVSQRLVDRIQHLRPTTLPGRFSEGIHRDSVLKAEAPARKTRQAGHVGAASQFLP